jgi:hypothetical protein
VTRATDGVTAGHGTSAPDACSVGFDRSGLSAYGTAAPAGFWLALEQEGPWGRVAATESHLPPETGRRLDEECTRRGGRLALLRRPGRHPDPHHEAGRTAYLAFSGTTAWLLVAHGASLEDLHGVDLDALARGDRAAVQASLPTAEPADPVLLVCTNGRRDVCCALRGRPVALEAAALSPGRVWESSHTGGHRFAPTGVLLPHGVALARLDGAGSAEVLAAADVGQLPGWALGARHDRGRGVLPPAAQAAESFVRDLVGETSLTALNAEVTDPAGGKRGPEGITSGSEEDGEHVTVRHGDGRTWTVLARRVGTGVDLAESCGKRAIAAQEWLLRLV